jgi:glycosyltransferase involved in cell wall biosynthesis
VLRVLTFGRYADADFGGVERYVFELAHALRDEVRYVNIVAARGAPPDTRMTGDTIYAQPLFEIGGTPVCPGMLAHARRLHREQPFDIVHLQFPADPMAHAAAASLPRSVRRVITWHSDIVRQRTLLKLYRPFLNRLIRSADAIIVPTPGHLRSSRQLEVVRDRSRLHGVPYGADLSRFERSAPGAEAIRARHRGKLLVFALGRHVYYKGFEYLIRALPSVPEAHVLLGGRGPLTEDLERLAADLGVAQRCEFVGRIPEEELPAYYQACDVFCMPSVAPAEAFGFVQIEAMAAGRPVVCCELNNGVTYVNRHGETGLVVPPADAEALGVALRRLGSEPSLRIRLGAQARERVKEFSVEAVASGTLAVYRRVLQSRW